MLLKGSHARFASAASTKGYLNTSIAAQFNVFRAIKGRDFSNGEANHLHLFIEYPPKLSVSVLAVNGKVSGAENFDKETVAKA